MNGKEENKSVTLKELRGDFDLHCDRKCDVLAC